MHITSENQKWTHKPSESSQCSHNLCSLIAAYILLDTFTQSGFCNLRKPLPRCCIHIFLAANRTDLGQNITNHNGRLTPGKCDRHGSRFSFSILADHTRLILHLRSPSVHFPVLDRKSTRLNSS